MCDATDVALVDVAGEETAAQFSRAFIFGGVGDLLGPLLLIAISLTGLGWRVAFGVSAATVAIYASWLATFEFPPPPGRHAEHTARAGLRPIVRDRRVWYFGVLAMLLGALDEDALAFLIAYLERDHGLSTAGAVSVAAASVVGRARRLHLHGQEGLPTAGARDAPRDDDHRGVTARCGGDRQRVGDRRRRAGLRVRGGARYWIALKTRVVGLYPDRVGSVQAVVSTIEYSAFLLPVFAGRLADTIGVRAGFALSAVVAVVTLGLIVVVERAQASKARAI